MDARNSIGAAFGWLGGGRHESTTAAERAGYQLAGILGLLNGLLTWLAATVAIASATSVSIFAILPGTLIAGLVVAVVSRALATGPRKSWTGLLGRALVALFIGAVIGEIAAVALFSAPIDRSLDAAALRQAAAAPAVVEASHELTRSQAERAGLDTAVTNAQVYVNQLLVIARCEDNPTSAACPQQEITGVPGDGPETRSANDRLAAAQTELTTVTAAHDQQAPGLDADITKAGARLAQAQTAASGDVDRSPGQRWATMHDYTVGHLGALLVRIVVDLFFMLLTAMALLLRQWHGETEQDRREQAKALRHQAEEDAATAIALKQAEVRIAAETLRAEQELERLRIEAEAQTAIEREEHRRRVAVATGVETEPPALPAGLHERIPALAAAAYPDLALPAGASASSPSTAVVAHGSPPRRQGPLSFIPDFIPVPDRIVDVSNAASDIAAPFLPPILAKALRIRSEIEEVEEVKLTYRRTRKETHTIEHEPGASEPAIRRVAKVEHVEWSPESGVLESGDSAAVDALDAPAGDLRPALGGSGRTALSAGRDPRALPPVKD